MIGDAPHQPDQSWADAAAERGAQRRAPGFAAGMVTPNRLGGEIEAVPLIKVDGKWRKADRARGAGSWRARVHYRGLDGLLSEVCARGRTRKGRVVEV